jgi:hypothetical protein
MDITEALRQADGRQVEVSGFLFVDRLAGYKLLCSNLLESDPPQCGGVMIQIHGPLPDAIELQQGADMAWSDRPVTLRGTLSERALWLGR